jgi:hypothetical protein
MSLFRKLGILALVALTCAALALVSAGSASASPSCGGCGGGGGGGEGGGGGDGGGSGGGGGGGGGTGQGGGSRLRVTGACGDVLEERVKQTGDPMTLTFTIPSADPTEVWSLTATQQDYNAVTGGRIGAPISLTPNPLPPLAFSSSEGGFTTTGEVPNTGGVTLGFSYTATRTSPAPLTCTNQAYWTNPSDGAVGPIAANPTGRPDTAPVLTGASEADAGTNDTLIQFDQEMLDTAQGTPAGSRFVVTVDGAARTATAVTIINDSPPFDAVVDVTFDGAPLTAGQTVTLQYRQPVINSQPALQDMESLQTAGFGPISIPAF